MTIFIIMKSIHILTNLEMEIIECLHRPNVFLLRIKCNKSGNNKNKSLD